MNEFNVWVTLSPILALAVNVAAQIVASRTVCRRLLLSVLAGAAAGEVFFLALGLPTLTPDTRLPFILVVQPAYIAASLCYLVFLGLNASSLRIRMLEELRAAGGKAPLREIMGRYDGQTVRQARLKRMSRHGLLIQDGDVYRSGKSPLIYFAYFQDGLREFLLKT